MNNDESNKNWRSTYSYKQNQIWLVSVVTVIILPVILYGIWANFPFWLIKPVRHTVLDHTFLIPNAIATDATKLGPCYLARGSIIQASPEKNYYSVTNNRPAYALSNMSLDINRNRFCQPDVLIANVDSWMMNELIQNDIAVHSAQKSATQALQNAIRATNALALAPAPALLEENGNN